MSDVSPRRLANALRALAMDAVQRANSGHPGMPMGMADVSAALFESHLKFCARRPRWADRDRFVLSAGHGSMLLYALLHLTGYEDMPMEQLRRFRQLGGRAAGHPEFGHAAGIETTTGPLGQGLANAAGMALAERRLAAEFGDALCDHRTWVVAGDGCLMEGISHEAASFAGAMRLHKLTVLFDDNHISIDGDTALACSDDTPARFAACGWHVEKCDGHDHADILRALAAARAAEKPSFIACRTTIGWGAPNKQGSAAAHGAPLGEGEVAAARDVLQWDAAAFEVPPDILAAWRAMGERHDGAAQEWEARLASHARGPEFLRRMASDLPDGWDAALRDWRKQLRGNAATGRMATRQASGRALAALAPALPELLGGSADLTGSNNTHAGQARLSSEDYGGGYVHYGVREHGMAAIMNGLALHGGFIPYAGTFLAFSDYCRPALRLAAMMGAHTLHVMTHDSIGLGEDGPTHQPVEQLAALRLIPGLDVYRPCDAAETAECWQLAIARKRPAVLALSRQALPPISGDAVGQCARGGYVLSDADGQRQITLAASGSEVSLALQAQALLAKEGVAAAVASFPCTELFYEQDAAWRRQVLPSGVPLLAIEAASPMPWLALAAAQKVRRVATVCMETFGASAPAEQLFEHFGFTAANCAAQARALLAAANEGEDDNA